MILVALDTGETVDLEKIVSDRKVIRKVRRDFDIVDVAAVASGIDVPLYDEVTVSVELGYWFTFSSENGNLEKSFTGKIVGDKYMTVIFTDVSIKEVSLFGDYIYMCNITLERRVPAILDYLDRVRLYFKKYIF